MDKKQLQIVWQFFKQKIKGTVFENHVFLVGGCVRDYLLDRTINDINVAVDLQNGGLDFANWIGENITKKQPLILPRYGTALNVVNIPEVGDVHVESNQTRLNASYTITEDMDLEDNFGNVLSDSVLRDLTINSMYLDVSSGEILDPTDGLKDMTSHTLCTTNAPDVIFKDDPIRMMRIIRFASILDWDIDKTTWFGILRNHELIKTTSTEKFVRELNQILLTDKPSVGLKRLISSGILYDMIPELYAINHIDGIDIKDNVWNHTLKVVDNSEPILLNRIAALLHDIGKPISHKIMNGKSRFYSHEFSGREAATSVLKRLRYSDRVIDSVRNAIRYHMTFTYTTTNNFLYIPSKKILRGFLNNVGDDKELVLDIIKANFLSRENKGCITFDNVIDALNHCNEEDKTEHIKLPINGKDIMETYGLKSSPTIGKALVHVKDEYIKNPSMTKEDALELVLDFLKSYSS